MDTPLKLLYAEDNPQDADLTSMHFARVAPDLRLEIVETGSHCLERLAAEPFDLLLLDNHLPDMDGLDVLEQIRAAGLRMPVVIITGVGDDETVARALRAGASDYISKTGSYLTGLPDILRRLVQQHRSQHQFFDESTQRPRRILHVEPNPMDVDLTASHFASAAPHLQLHTVSNCHDALALLATGYEFDLVLTDLRVPGMNALEFLHEAKHQGVELPFIVITGRGDEATAVAILRLGAYDYLVKRENYLTQLPHAIDHALQRFQLDQQTRRLNAQLASLNASLEEKVAARTAELQREVDERRRLEIRNREQLDKLTQSEAESRRLLEIAEESRRALLGILEDQQMLEQALRDAERHLRNVLDTLPALIAVLSPEGMMLDCNRLPAEVFGVSLAATIGRPFAELPPWCKLPVQQAELKAAIQRAAAGETVHYDVELPLPTGATVVVATWIVPLKDEAGRVTQLIASGIDITERTRVEEERRQLAMRNQALVTALGEVVYDTYPLRNHIVWGGDFTRVLGYTPEEVGNDSQSWISRVHAEDVPDVLAEVESAKRDRRNFDLEYRYRCRDGSYKWMHDSGVLFLTDDGNFERGIGVLRDITERKRIEEALRTSEERLSLAIAAAQLGIFEHDHDTDVIYWSPRLRQLIGWGDSESPSLPDYLELVTGEEHEEIDAAVQRAHDPAGNLHYRAEHRIVLRDGRVRWVSILSQTIFEVTANTRRPIRTIGTVEDITESKQAEQALRESELKFSTIFHHSPLAIVLTVPQDGRILDVNDTYCREFGYTREELIGRTTLELGIWANPSDRAKFLANFLEFGGHIGPFEAQYRHKSGELRDRLTFSHVVEVGGRQVALGISEDVTERKRAEAALRESQQRLALATESAHIGIWDWDIATNRLVWDSEMCQLYGIRPQDFSGVYADWENRLHPDDREKAAAEFRAALIGTRDYHTEFRVVWPDGKVRYIETHGMVQRAEDGAALRVLGTNLDVTERKRAEKSLRYSELKFATIFHSNPLPISLTTPEEGRFLEVNENYCRQLGYSREELVGRTVLELGIWAVPSERAPKIAELLAHGRVEPFETQYYTRSGELRDMLNVSHLIELDGQSVILGINQDITDRKRAEEALRDSEHRLRELFDASPDALFILDAEGHILDANQTAVSRYGYSRLELLQLSPRELTASDLLEHSPSRVRDALTHGAQFEWRHRRKDGAEFPVEIIAKPITLNGRQTILSCVRDISARKQAEESARESQTMLELIHDSIPQGVFWKDRNSVYQGANRVSRNAMGLASADDVVGLTDFDLPSLQRKQAEFFVRKDREVMDSGRPQYAIIETMTLPNGETIWLETNKIPLHDADGHVTGILGTWQDITERQKANEEIRISRERLAVLSRQLIAAQESERRRLALELHDQIGQALTGIKLNLKALQQQAKAQPVGRLVHDTIAVVDQTLHQVRGLALDLRPSMLDDIGLVAALRWNLNRQAQRAGFVPTFVADSNISGGSPEIKTACFRVAQESLTNVTRHAQARNVRVELQEREGELQLLITDDGIGFDVSAARAKASQGASIGLLGMAERVQLVGGQFEIESNPSQGTTIRARFPIPTKTNVE